MVSVRVRDILKRHEGTCANLTVLMGHQFDGWE